jgi:outer membrane protein assembly factor BamB
LRSKSLTLLGAVLALALIVAGCGPVQTQTWPGLATNDEFAFVAQGQQVHAIRLADGTLAWSFPAQPNNQVGALTSDAGVGDAIVVVGSEGPAGQYSGILYGLDLTGQQRWCLAFDAKGAQRQNCPLASGGTQAGFLGLAPAVDNRIVGGVTVVDGMAYFGLANGAVYAVDTASGRDRWRFEAERDVWAAPLVSQGRAYVASLDHHIYALEADTGRLVWSEDVGAAVAGTPTLSEDGGTLYVGTFGSKLFALDTGSGAPVWDFDATNWVWSGPALDDGMLYFTDVAGTVFALDAGTGNRVWDAKPGGTMRSRPALSETLVLAGDRDGNLWALDKATGSVVWQQTLEGRLLAAPLVVDDMVLVAPFQGENSLVAYSLAGDAVRWAFAPSR